MLCRVAASGVEFELALDVREHAAGAEAEQIGVEPGIAELFFHQGEPFERLLRGADTACGFEARQTFRFRWAYSRIARVMTKPTGNVAFVASFPVDVLMKSAPAIMATMLARATLRSVSRSPVPRITFMCAEPQAALKVAISSNRCLPLAAENVSASNDYVDFVGAGLDRAANLGDSFVERR